MTIKEMLPELSENQVKWLYRQLKDSVIGADEEESITTSEGDDLLSGTVIDRNELRAEIRAALSSFFGVEGESS